MIPYSNTEVNQFKIRNQMQHSHSKRGTQCMFFTHRVTAYESRHGETSGVSALKYEVADLRKGVDYLKSTDFTSLIWSPDNEDAPKTSGIPPATTGDVHRGGTADEESDAKTSKELIAVYEEEMIEGKKKNI
ncbi:hypothetical protein H5410_046208 [Solanum commersonii]|uniref:Uncharacterized protein n=1 Tax=Solanum commersonii TaxID=4109 RepID=A0A9J5XF07_SOLCO|nr:hypothetical protein H5410_046208 [Solanum commersonii]